MVHGAAEVTKVTGYQPDFSMSNNAVAAYRDGLRPASIGTLVFGDDDHGNSVVVRLAYPRLIARVVETDEDGLARHPDEAADLISGIVFSSRSAAGEFLLCEVQKLDDDSDFDLQGALSAMAAFAALHLSK
jgi:hypothetical protein